MPRREKAKRWPVRPNPDWISSAISRIFFIAETPQGLGEFAVQEQKAGFALYRFDDEAGYIVDVDFYAEQSVHGLQCFSAGDTVIGTGVGQVIHRAGQYADLCL